MLAWSGLYWLCGCLAGAIEFTGFPDLAAYLLTEPVHLWYCYAILALYLFTPPLRAFCRSATKGELRYALALTFLFGSVVTIVLRWGGFPLLPTILDKMKVDSSLGFVFLYLMGHYLRVYPLPPRPRHLLYALGAAGLAVTYGGTAWLSREGELNDLLFSFFAPNVIASSLAVYVLIRQLCKAHPISKGAGLIQKLGACTTGVYFIHPMVITAVETLGIEPWAGLPAAIPLRTLVFFAISMGLVLLLQKIPLLRRLVR